MTKLMRILEAERRAAASRFKMQGVVTRKNFISVARTFGVRKALKVLFTTQATALTILMG